MRRHALADNRPPLGLRRDDRLHPEHARLLRGRHQKPHRHIGFNVVLPQIARVAAVVLEKAGYGFDFRGVLNAQGHRHRWALAHGCAAGGHSAGRVLRRRLGRGALFCGASPFRCRIKSLFVGRHHIVQDGIQPAMPVFGLAGKRWLDGASLMLRQSGLRQAQEGRRAQCEQRCSIENPHRFMLQETHFLSATAAKGWPTWHSLRKDAAEAGSSLQACRQKQEITRPRYRRTSLSLVWGWQSK